jgi:hypothetical protein
MFIELLAKYRAKRKYVYKELFEAEIADLQAGLAQSRANEKLKLAKQLIADADEIEGNIKREEAKPEYQALTGQEKYEADREKHDAEKIAENKRVQAKQEEEEAKGSLNTVKHFRRTAAAGRETARRLRSL